MKKILLFTVFLSSFFISNSQIDLDYGLKLGIGVNKIDDLEIGGGFTGFVENVNSTNNISYLFGGYTKIQFSQIFIRPELIYTNSKSEYTETNSTITRDFKLQTLEVPVLVGTKLFKFISVYIGPSASIILDNEFPTFEFFETNDELNIDKTVAFLYNVGISAQLSKFGVDLRYSGGLSKNLGVNFEAVVVDGPSYTIDTRTNMFSISISYQLN